MDKTDSHSKEEGEEYKNGSPLTIDLLAAAASLYVPVDPTSWGRSLKKKHSAFDTDLEKKSHYDRRSEEEELMLVIFLFSFTLFL